MNASDIMTSPVISVGPETPAHEIATLLLKHRISGVPVVEHGRLIVESDAGRTAVAAGDVTHLRY